MFMQKHLLKLYHKASKISFVWQSSFKAAGFENPSNGSGSSYRRTTHDSDSDDADKHESDDEPIETNRFKDLKVG